MAGLLDPPHAAEVLYESLAGARANARNNLQFAYAVAHLQQRGKKDILNDVAGDPDARGRTPAICEVLQGNKLLRENDLEIEGVEGPPSRQSTTVVVHYRILHPGILNPAMRNSGAPDAPPEETPKERARRLTNKMAGLLKDEIAAYGGGDAFMKWVRSDDDEAA